MSFCITVEKNGKKIATSFYSQFIKYEHYEMISEVIECMHRYNEFVSKYHDTELVLNMLNTRKNMELCGYSWDMCAPIFDKMTNEIVRRACPRFKRNKNIEDNRIISIVDEAMEDLEKFSTYNIIIDIGTKKIFFNIYRHVDKDEAIEDMELEPSFDFSEIEDLDFELFNLPIYDLEDLKNTIKKFENNIFKDSKTGMYLIPGKEDVIKLSL